MATLKEIIKEMGENYMKIIRKGRLPSEEANEAGYRQCWQCNDWNLQENMATSGGIEGEAEICEYCIIHSHSGQAKHARQALINNGNEDIPEPKRKKRTKKVKEPKNDWDGFGNEDAFLNNEDAMLNPEYIKLQKKGA